MIAIPVCVLLAGCVPPPAAPVIVRAVPAPAPAPDCDALRVDHEYIGAKLVEAVQARDGLRAGWARRVEPEPEPTPTALEAAEAQLRIWRGALDDADADVAKWQREMRHVRSRIAERCIGDGAGGTDG